MRITGPNASVAQDLEPESIALSPDGRLAWVTLERNNALALIDVESGNLLQILPLVDKNNMPPASASMPAMSTDRSTSAPGPAFAHGCSRI